MGCARLGWTACGLFAAALLLLGIWHPREEGGRPKAKGAKTGPLRPGVQPFQASRHAGAQTDRRLQVSGEQANLEPTPGSEGESLQPAPGGEEEAESAPGGEEEAERSGEPEEGRQEEREAGDAFPEEFRHEEEEEEEVSSTTRVIASLLIGFLVVDIMLLHLVNYQDPDVRTYIYSMICTTMSIFCAVLLNQAWCSFMITQVLESPFPRGFGLHHVGIVGHVLVGGVTFVSTFTLLNVLCYTLRDNASHITAVEEIGGHITAFAGIRFFGFEQYREVREGYSAAVVCVIALLILWLFCHTSWSVRRCFLLERSAQSLEQLEAEEGEEERSQLKDECDKEEEDLQRKIKAEHRWRHAVNKAENEVLAIIMSYLTFQAITFTITGHIEPPEGGSKWPHNQAHIRMLFYISLVFICAIVLTTYIVTLKERRLVANNPAGTMANLTRDLFEDKENRLVNLWENYLAMTMSWMTMRVVYWCMRLHFTDDRHISQVATAAVVTVIAVSSIIALDCIADWINARKHRRRKAAKVLSISSSVLQTPRSHEQRQQQQQPGQYPQQQQLGPPAAQRPLDSETSSSEDEDSSAESAGQNFVQVAKKSLPGVQRLSSALFTQDSVVNAVILDESSLERALRTVIVGFSLLVGLCWEKAFDAADESLVDGFELCRSHPVIAKIIMALGNTALVIPAWLWFMVPMAKMRWTEHQAMMDLEKLQAETSSQDSRINMSNFANAANRLSNEQLIVAMKNSLRWRSQKTTEDLCRDLQAALNEVN